MNTTLTSDIARTAQTHQTLIGQIERAADDFRTAGAQISAALEIARRNPNTCAQSIGALESSMHDAQTLTARMESIAEFADSTEQAIASLAHLIRAEDFGIRCENVMRGADEAAELLNALGFSRVVARTGDGDEATIYNARTYAQRTMFAHVTALRYRMAHQLGVVDPAGPLSADLAHLRTERTEMMSTYNALLEYAPDDIGASAHEYAKGLTALAVAIQALSILIAHGDGMAHMDGADKFWRKYCESAEAREAKVAIISAHQLCPIDIC